VYNSSCSITTNKSV